MCVLQLVLGAWLSQVQAQLDQLQLPRSLQLEPGRCWGYEDTCSWEARAGAGPRCEPGARGWGGEPDPRRTFHQQADFGHLAEKLRTMKPYCRAQASTEAGISRCQQKISAFSQYLRHYSV